MRAWHIFLIGMGAIILSSSFTVASARTQNPSPWVLYQAAINAKPAEIPFPWGLYQAVIQFAALERKTLIREDGIWWGLHNGGRPTFYFTHLMADYPPTFTLVEEGCEEVKVINNGHRFETNNIILKQSDVGGRGMALTNQFGKCTGSTASHILYYKEEMPRENPPIFMP